VDHDPRAAGIRLNVRADHDRELGQALMSSTAMKVVDGGGKTVLDRGRSS
jgi:hypothetical protein